MSNLGKRLLMMKLLDIQICLLTQHHCFSHRLEDLSFLEGNTGYLQEKEERIH